MPQFILVLSIFLISLSTYAQSNTDKWGKEEGHLNWKSALEKCKSNGMRLPTMKELLFVYKSHEQKKWYGNWYWANDEFDAERAWIVVLNIGATALIPKQYHNYVRCIYTD